MRISTAQLFQNGIETLQRQQAALAHTQQQLSTGRRVLTPSDDPSSAVQSLNLREHVAALTQYERNAELGTRRLQHEETVLEQMSLDLQRIRELAVRGANGSQSDESRAAIAREVRQLADGLLQTANTRDAGGEYLFAGFRSNDRPFARNGAGGVEYLGDAGQRTVAVSADRAVPVGDSGDVFMNVPRGNGRFLASPAESNTGTAAVTAADVVDPAAVDSQSYRIGLVTATTYEVRDGNGALVSSGEYGSGQAIDIGGRRVVLEGTPAAGDRFDITPAGTTSIFAIADRLATSLGTGASSSADRVKRTHEVEQAIADIDRSLTSVLELRSGVGARLNAIDSQVAASGDERLQLETALSALEDLNYAEAISRFQLQQVAVQAAQQTYVQMGRMSLFDYLR